MPRTISEALKAHKLGDLRTTAYCLSITSKYNTTGTPDYTFTTHQNNIVYDGATYVPTLSATPSAVQINGNMDNGTLSCSGAFSIDGLRIDHLQSGYLDGASFTIFEINYMDVTMGIMELFSGEFGDVSGTDYSYQTEIQGMEAVFDRAIGSVVQRNCGVEFCSSRCGLTAATYTVSPCTVTAVDSSYPNKIFTVSSGSGLVATDDYYGNGLVTWITGDNARLTRVVTGWTASTRILTLIENMPYAIGVGDTFSIIAGCRKRYQEDCITKYNNAVNFQGYPYAPTEEEFNKTVKFKEAVVG